MFVTDTHRLFDPTIPSPPSTAREALRVSGTRTRIGRVRAGIHPYRSCIPSFGISDGVLVLKTAPPLDPAWVTFERESGMNAKPQHASQQEADRPTVARQPIYVAECRALLGKMME